MSLLFNIRKHLHHHPRSSWMLPLGWIRFWICLHISLVLNKYTQFKSECICGSLWVGWLYHICFCLVINYVWGNTNVKIRTYQLNSHPRFLCYYIPTLSLLFGRSTSTLMYGILFHILYEFNVETTQRRREEEYYRKILLAFEL